MKALITLALALLATFTFSFAAVPDDIRGNLDKLVPEAIRLLEAKDYVTLIETLATPDDLKRIASEGSVAKIAEEFGKEKAASLLAVLKSLADKKPKLSEDGNTATFDISEVKGAPKETLTFARIEGRWYIKN